jgi:hypothetical protein
MDKLYLTLTDLKVLNETGKLNIPLELNIVLELEKNE